MMRRRAPAGPAVVDRLDVESLPKGAVTRLYVEMMERGTVEPIRLSVLVARGQRPGPVLGVTAAMHGNELNGIPIIHRLFRELDPAKLSGTVVAVPVVNIPGFIRLQRGFSDGQDLNRLMPGKEHGNGGQVYAARLMDRVISQFQYLIDLHTASFGRINSLYVRVDMTNPVTRELAMLQHPQIIVHNQGEDGTLRAAAMARGINAITVEVGDPQRFQAGLVQVSLVGLRNVLARLEMFPSEPPQFHEPPVVCGRSSWMYTDTGGLLEVFPPVATHVRKGQVIARVSNLFGDVLREYEAPEDGIVVGKSTNPVNQTGDRILHLGIPGLG
jgi:predicted deacylase